MARKRSRGSQNSNNSDPRRKGIVALTALACTGIGCGIGYVFGYFIAPMTDLVHEFSTKDSSAFFFLYAFGLIGLLIGIKVGQGLHRSLRRREQSRARRERYKDHLEQYERDQAELAGKDDGYRSDRMATTSRKQRDFESPWP